MNPLSSLAPALKDIASAQKTSFATTQATWRFLNNEKVSFQRSLINPLNLWHRLNLSNQIMHLLWLHMTGLSCNMSNIVIMMSVEITGDFH